MPEPGLVEQPATTAEAVLGARPSNEIGISTRVRERRAMAEKIRTEVGKDIDAKKIAEGLSPHPVTTEGEVNRINSENIGTKRKGGDGPDAGEKDYTNDPKAEFRRKTVDNEAKLARELIDKGYDGLEASGGITKVQKQQELVNRLVAVATSWPEGKAVFDSLSDAEKKQRVEEVFLRNPQFLKKLSAHFAEIYSGDDAMFRDTVSEAQDEYTAAQKKYDLKKREVDGLNREKRATSRSLKDYKPGGEEYTAYTARKANQAALEATRNQKMRDLEKANDKIRKLQPQLFHNIRNPDTGALESQQRPDIRDLIDEIQEKEIDPLQDALDDAVAELGKIKSFEDTLASLENKDAELSEKILTAETDFADLDLERTRAKRKLDVARAARSAEEEKFVHDVQGMVKEAGMRHFKSEVERYEASQKKLSQKAIEEAGSKDAKSLEKRMAKDWRVKTEVGTFSKRTVERVDKARVKASYEKMVSERSMDWYVKEVMDQDLIALGNRVGIASQEYKEEYERVQDRLKDPEFMKKMSGLAAERLMKNYFESGQKPKSEDLSVLTETEWGKGAIEAGLEKRKEVNDLVEKMRQSNNFSGSKSEFLKALAKNPNAYKKAGIGIAGILALIFGAPFLAVGAGALASGYAAAGEAVGAPLIS